MLLCGCAIQRTLDRPISGHAIRRAWAIFSLYTQGLYQKTAQVCSDPFEDAAFLDVLIFPQLIK